MMPIENGALVHNSGGTMNLHGPVVGGNGNQVNVTHQAAAVATTRADLLSILATLRIAAASAGDLPRHVQAEVLTAAANAQHALGEGDVERAGVTLLETRRALAPVPSGSAAAIRGMLECALELVPRAG